MTERSLRLRASLVIGFLLATFASFQTVASGYGWYVSSFEWSDYQRESAQIEKKAQAIAKEERNAYPLSIYRTRVLFQLMRSGPGTSPLVPTVDESPVSNEFYWADALRYAAEHQEKAGIKTLFRLFASGRPLWALPGSAECKSYECLDAYVILTPDEVKAFHAEVARFNANAHHPEDYEVYLLHLEGVLRKASAEDRALFSHGND
jgi:hypothetical protein